MLVLAPSTLCVHLCSRMCTYLNEGHYAMANYPRYQKYGPTTRHNSLCTFFSRKIYNFFTQRNALRVVHLVFWGTTLEQCPQIPKCTPLEPLKAFPLYVIRCYQSARDIKESCSVNIWIRDKRELV